MAGDWRLTVTLPQHADLEAFELWLDQNLPEGDVTRHHAKIHVYANDPRDVRAAERVLALVADELEVSVRVVVDRWNPGRGEWQPPGVAVDAVETPPASSSDLDFDSFNHEVVASSPERLDRELVERLQRELGVFALDSRRLWGASADAGEAQLLHDRLFLELPPGTQIRVQPFTRRRRWLRKQRLVGNYESGGERS